MTGLFRSAQDALLFAFRHAGQAYDRPMMLRMADTSRGAGAWLAGLDGAAQAGMIRAEVASLGRLYEAVIVARFADRSIPCQCKAACCSGERLNGEWINAVAYLADYGFQGSEPRRLGREGWEWVGMNVLLRAEMDDAVIAKMRADWSVVSASRKGSGDWSDADEADIAAAIREAIKAKDRTVIACWSRWLARAIQAAIRRARATT